VYIEIIIFTDVKTAKNEGLKILKRYIEASDLSFEFEKRQVIFAEKVLCRNTAKNFLAE
jgi:hypothetical protein